MNNKLIGDYALLNSHIKRDSNDFIQKGSLMISYSSKKRFLVNKVVLLCINIVLLIYFFLLAYFNKHLFIDADYGVYIVIFSIILYSFLIFSFAYIVFHKQSFKNNQFNFFKIYSINVNDDFLFLKREESLIGIFEKIYFYISFASYIGFFTVNYILVFSKKLFEFKDIFSYVIYLIWLITFCFYQYALTNEKFDTYSYTYNNDVLTFNSHSNKFFLDKKKM